MPVGKKPELPILGDHPSTDPFAKILSAKHGVTASDTPHRATALIESEFDAAVQCFRKMLEIHHADQELRDLRAAAVADLGLTSLDKSLSIYPKTDKTQKGNLAEIVLAEYVLATTDLRLPVYRLHYNPNVDQSMKGDDLLAFDLDSDPIRILVGEAKFRKAPTKTSVVKIAQALLSSHKKLLPASLPFIASTLLNAKQPELAKKVLQCEALCTLGKVRLDYVGLLMSNPATEGKVHQHTPKTDARLLMMSLGLNDPERIVSACYNGLL